MKGKRAWACGVAASALMFACAAAVGPPTGARDAAPAAPITLRVFDSRAVALAWAGSEAFGESMAGLRRDLADAKAAGDDERVAELEALGPKLQERLHAQGFSTGSVDDLLEHVKDEIPGIAQRAGVDAIVCRWDVVYQAPSASFVDVTELLAGAFDPDEKTWKSIREIVATGPVPLDQLTHEH